MTRAGRAWWAFLVPFVLPLSAGAEPLHWEFQEVGQSMRYTQLVFQADGSWPAVFGSSVGWSGWGIPTAAFSTPAGWQKATLANSLCTLTHAEVCPVTGRIAAGSKRAVDGFGFLGDRDGWDIIPGGKLTFDPLGNLWTVSPYGGLTRCDKDGHWKYMGPMNPDWSAEESNYAIDVDENGCIALARGTSAGLAYHYYAPETGWEEIGLGPGTYPYPGDLRFGPDGMLYCLEVTGLLKRYDPDEGSWMQWDLSALVDGFAPIGFCPQLAVRDDGIVATALTSSAGAVYYVRLDYPALAAVAVDGARGAPGSCGIAFDAAGDPAISYYDPDLRATMLAYDPSVTVPEPCCLALLMAGAACAMLRPAKRN